MYFVIFNTRSQIENLYVQQNHCRGLLVSDLISYSSCAITYFPCARLFSKSSAFVFQLRWTVFPQPTIEREVTSRIISLIYGLVVVRLESVINPLVDPQGLDNNHRNLACNGSSASFLFLCILPITSNGCYTVIKLVCYRYDVIAAFLLTMRITN